MVKKQFVGVWLTPSEKSKLERAAKAQKFSLSRYLKESFLYSIQSGGVVFREIKPSALKRKHLNNLSTVS